MTADTSQEPTRERILKAAGDVFGEQGFRSATIRAIARAAGANVASINYYFRDKEGLYSAVLEDIFSTVFRQIPVVMTREVTPPAGERLRFFIRGMIHRFLSSRGWGGYAGRGKLIAREFLDPTPAFETIVETYIRPHRNLLVGMVGEIAGADPESGPVQACALSIIGQCVYYAFATPIIQRIAPVMVPDEASLDRLADHVWRFSLGGILSVSNDGRTEAPDADDDRQRFTTGEGVEESAGEH